jgi:hypothetical protein
MRELQFAASSYSGWFDGQAGLPGLVILDASARDDGRFIRETAWTIIYDRSPAWSMGGDGRPYAPQKAGPRDSAVNAKSFALSRAGGEFDLTRRGILAHEICHKYAFQAFEQAWGGGRVFPDMLDEAAAISCESEQMKAERISQFAEQFAKGAAIPWHEFLATKHPFKDGEAMKELRRLAGAGRGAVTFDISPGSPYEAKIGIFYSQAAAFGAFVSERSCKGTQAIGALLSTYDPRHDLDQWLRSNGARLCLPNSIDAFEKSFFEYIDKWKSKQ